jgi:hypothetical protein
MRNQTRSSARFSRQQDLVHCNVSTPILIIGAGAIGSFTALTLAKMGFESLTVFDMDTVEEHNLPNQFYKLDDVGKAKVHALREMVREFTGATISIEQAEFTGMGSYLPTVVISAIDNMKGRALIYEAFKTTDVSRVYIDGRMGADQAEVYVVEKNKPKTMEIYEGRLWTDEEAEVVRCTSKATMYNVLSIASMISNNVRLALQNEPCCPAVILDNKNMTMFYLK